MVSGMKVKIHIFYDFRQFDLDMTSMLFLDGTPVNHNLNPCQTL